jgi:hypothetical protein
MLPTENECGLIVLYLLANETPETMSRSTIRQELQIWFQISTLESNKNTKNGVNLLDKRLSFHLSSLGGKKSGGQLSFQIAFSDQWGITMMGLKYLFNNYQSTRKNIAQNSPEYAKSSHHRQLDFIEPPATIDVKLSHTQRLNAFRKELQKRHVGIVNHNWDIRFV